jgi:hypothetical protein
MTDYFDDVEKLRLKGPLPPLPASARVRSKRNRQEGEFVVISREQSDRLDKARWYGSERVFRHLLFLTWRAPDKPVKVGNIAFNRKGTDRRIKYRALKELENLGLIRAKWEPRKSPFVIVLRP